MALGLVGMLGGVGWATTRALFQVESITQETILELQRKEREAEEQALDDLMRKLRQDRDHRNDDYLIMLRTIRDDFEASASQPGVEIRSREVVVQVRQLFMAAVTKLHRSYDLWELAEKLSGEESENVLKEREQVLSEIKATVDHLKSATDQYKGLMYREQEVDLSQLRDELDRSLRIAKKTEERMREFESQTNYDKFLKE